MNLINELAWNAPQIVKTVNGIRSLRVAAPTPEFWSAWNSDKDGCRAAGLSCRRGRDGWEVCHWAAVDAEPVAAAEVVAAPVVSSGRPARKVEGFICPALDSSRKWSDEQLAIFEWFRSGSGSLVVRARAGTGKTTTIKAAFSQAAEETMLYAVFNKKNQIEAQAAICDARVDIKTLHSVGFSFIKSVWSNVKPDDSVEKDRIRQVIGDSAPDEVAGILAKFVAWAKNTTVNPSVDELMVIADEEGFELPDFEDIGWTVKNLALKVRAVLDLSLKRDAQSRISFNDMVWLPVAAGWVRPSYDLVCVDEAQDMNLPQLLMARKPSDRTVECALSAMTVRRFMGFVALPATEWQ